MVDDRPRLGQSAGMLTLETLPHQIRSGEVHTVVVAFPDLQGRPVGKRVTGSFFLEHVADHGIEACDYLLACDVDMRQERPACISGEYANGVGIGIRARQAWASETYIRIPIPL